jgi:hypothetical protein
MLRLTPQDIYETVLIWKRATLFQINIGFFSSRTNVKWNPSGTASPTTSVKLSYPYKL